MEILGMFMLIFGIALIFIISLFYLFYGKRWYCSWVCGCGGLAETAGSLDISNNSTVEGKRWMIHSVLVFSFVMTIAVLFTFLSDNPEISFITKDHFRGIVSFSCRLQEHLYF
jgi:polyferredoxin